MPKKQVIQKNKDEIGNVITEKKIFDIDIAEEPLIADEKTPVDPLVADGEEGEEEELDTDAVDPFGDKWEQ